MSKGWSSLYDVDTSPTQGPYRINDRYDVLRQDPSRVGAFRVTQQVAGSRWVAVDDLLSQVYDPRNGETILLRDQSTGDIRGFKATRSRVTFEPVRI